LIGVLLTLIAVAGYATQSRISVLNMAGYMSDIMSCWSNPGYMVVHHNEIGKDAVGMEFGFDNPTNNGDMDRWGYLHYGNANQYLGIAVNRPATFRGLFDFQNNLPAGMTWTPAGLMAGTEDYVNDTLQVPNNILDVIWSKNWGPKAGLGINLNFGYWGYSTTAPNWEPTLNSMKIGLLLGYYTMPMDVTVGFDMLTSSAEIKAIAGAVTTTDKFDNSNMAVNLGFKYKMYPNQTTKVILPLVGLSYETGNGEYDPNGVDWNPTLKYTDLSFVLGTGIVWSGATWQAGLAAELGYETGKLTKENDVSNNNDQEGTMNTITFPRVKAGAESQVFSWLTARAGMTYQLNMVTEKLTTTAAGASVENERKTQFGKNMNVQVGLGVHFGPNFTIDTEVSEDLLYNGPYLISGANNGTDPMNLCVSAVYHF
ncbi:hypothetical protein JXL83_01770, partial [candidate division WOR-3 bacterium]|nr:hypothetical protein [candidate division WOR-3 bacterium]